MDKATRDRIREQAKMSKEVKPEIEAGIVVRRPELTPEIIARGQSLEPLAKKVLSETTRSSKPPKKADIKLKGKPKVYIHHAPCGHITKKGLPTELCGPCRQAAEQAAAAERRKNQKPRPPGDGMRHDAQMVQAGRLPDKSKFEAVYDAASQTWIGTLTIPEVGEFKDQRSGVFRLLRFLDCQYRSSVQEKMI